MSRNIVTTFFFGRKIMKVNRGSILDMSVLHAIGHMQKNRYCARIAQISDAETGKLYAVITRNITGKINILYQDNSILLPLVKEDGLTPRDDREGIPKNLTMPIDALIEAVA